MAQVEQEREADMQKAIAAWIKAMGLDPQDPDLQGTPERVTTLWREAFLSGYARDPAQILGDPVPADGQSEAVIVRKLPCHGMCPHHFMPWVGTACIAYLPGQQLVGFGRLQELLRCFAQRLSLQERVTSDIADALMEHLDARGAACTIEAQHLCLCIPDDKHDARVYSSALRGAFRTRPDLQMLLAQ